MNTGAALSNHFKWLSDVAGVKITPEILAIIQSGAMYIHGRDKLYRVTIITDIPKMTKLGERNPDAISTQNMQNAFVFLWSYLKKAMFLPGISDHWNTITDMGWAGMWALPRAQLLAIMSICQSNMMYMLNRSFYVNASWGQMLCFKAMQPFLDPVTRLKLNMSSGHHPDLLELYHPCQLEKRFGGQADTPTNFWPPHVGKQFNPDADKSSITQYILSDEQYVDKLKLNPHIFKHPDFMDSNDFSRDFLPETKIAPTPEVQVQHEEVMHAEGKIKSDCQLLVEIKSVSQIKDARWGPYYVKDDKGAVVQDNQPSEPMFDPDDFDSLEVRPETKKNSDVGGTDQDQKPNQTPTTETQPNAENSATIESQKKGKTNKNACCALF